MSHVFTNIDEKLPIMSVEEILRILDYLRLSTYHAASLVQKGLNEEQIPNNRKEDLIVLDGLLKTHSAILEAVENIHASSQSFRPTGSDGLRIATNFLRKSADLLHFTYVNIRYGLLFAVGLIMILKEYNE